MTLTEVLAALTVLSVGLVALISLLPLAAFGVREGAQRSSAIFLAAERIEQIRHGLGTGPALIADADETPLTGPDAAFDRTVRVRDCGLPPGCSGAESPGIHEVTVMVTYPTGSAPAHRGTVVLSAYVGAP